MHKFFKKKKIYYINIFFILSIWFCIDTNFDNISLLGYVYTSPFFSIHDLSIKHFFLFFRSSGPFILFFILFFLYFFYKDKIYFLTKNKGLNFSLIILYINFTFEFVALLTSENDIRNSYYTFLSIFSIIVTANLYNYGLSKFNYLLSLCVLTIVVLVFGGLAYEYVLTTRNLNMYGTFPDVFLPLENFSSNVIRSSGLSRSSMILLIPIFYLILIDKIKFYYFIPYSKFVLLIPYLILSSIIYYCQSRIIVLFYLLFIIFSIIYFLRNKTIKYIIQKLFILFLLPMVFVFFTIYLKEAYHEQEITNKFSTIILKKESTYAAPERNPGHLKVRKFEITSFTSHRNDFWKAIIKKSKKPIIGYGALGDRFLLVNYNNSAHNILICSYASGGIISLILMLILILRYAYLCFFLTFFKKIRLVKKNVFIFSSIFTISFLLSRGITENSVAVFSIDLLVFLSCITICEKFKSQKLQ